MILYHICYYYRGFLTAINCYVVTYCSDAYCDTWLLNKTTGKTITLINPFDNETCVPLISKDEKEFPNASTINEKFKGVKATDNYKPVVELLRFMTPFGVGHYSNEKGKHRKPVYIPKWENEVVWENDISQLASEVSNNFYVGVWIDSWTEEGYKVDLELMYSNRPRKTYKVQTLVNTIPYVNGQSLPDFFANGMSILRTDLDAIAAACISRR